LVICFRNAPWFYSNRDLFELIRQIFKGQKLTDVVVPIRNNVSLVSERHILTKSVFTFANIDKNGNSIKSLA
jgi:hypothetical protein